MTKNELVEALKTIHKELNMSPSEYVEYINEKHGITNEADKVTLDRVMAYRTGSVNAQIENVLTLLNRG